MPSRSAGKTITKIKINKKDVVISFSDKSKLRCPLEVMASFYLYEGKTLQSKELKEIKDFSSSAALMKYALGLLKKGHYSEWKMREKLYNKDTSKANVDQVIKVLKKNDLINDEMLAYDLVEYGNERNLGKNKIRQELSDKGIFDEIIKKFKFPDSIERKKAANNLPKLERKYNKYPFESKKQHIFEALLSLGFDSEIAFEMMNKISLPKEKEEQEKLDKDIDKVVIHLKRKYEGYDLKDRTIKSLHSKGYKMKDIMKAWEKKYGEIDY